MKRIDNGVTKDFKHCWLYKEDIDRLISLMTVDGLAPELRSGDFEFENAAELYQFLGKKGGRSLNIKSVKPRAHFTTSLFGSVRVLTYDDSNDARALHSRIVEATEGGIKRPNWRSRFLTYLAGMILMMFGAGNAYSHTGPARYIGGLACVVGIALLISHATYKREDGTRFFGVARADRQSFLQRKGDDLAVALIAGTVGAVVGGVLGVVGTLIVQQAPK
ncbi:hypothetical protein [Paraburkholderia aspalathi]|uniref:Uncharacterized protein n=1 Tax=Paraburkholderia aspalathi TaxID=1324617 RepID=A0A1I7EFL1_9BURK|nr:hypothetical protein [Paraburkholderia aspalathi]SFU22717.1 hypothetical protein SAMN05192563_101910 [Paraburkholderia aspalathi]